jgi:hypothetical protein
MALDPNIALGVRGIEIANPLAQYSQVAQIQNAQNQNALAQYQLGTAQRQDVAQNALSDAYKAAYNPETGGIDSNLLMRGLAERGAGHLIPDVQTKMLATQKEQGLIKKTAVETTGLEFDQRIKKANKAISDIAALNTPEEAIASINKNLANGNIDQEKADMLKGQITSAPSFGAWQTKMLTNILDAKGKLEQQRVTTKDTDRGGYIERQTYDAQGMPVGLPIKLPKTATIGEQTAQGQLGLAQQKFAWEKANPGFELKEAEDGSIVGVNKRTLQAFPVSVGGVAPAAAPMAGAGMPGARLPVSTGQAIPGMTSVLDQQAPAAVPAAGTPLRGKGTAMTESQSNATAYGMRMKEANAILEEMAKKGTLRGANIEAVPLVGEGLGKILPSVLGGTSADQQQVNQAKSNFITAVLRKESGAVISDSEFDREDKKYFPQVNDSPAVIKQKENARKLAIKAIEVQAGPGAKSIQQLQPSAGGGVDTSNPLLR